MATVYRKTRLGQSEIETRALRLMPRLRSLLIVVDGQRDQNTLQSLLGVAPDPLLKELLAHGLIEAVPQKAPAAAVVGGDSQSAAPSSTLDRPSFEILRRDAVRALNDLLGPAAEGLAVRMERASNEAELRSLLERAALLVGNVRGAEAGKRYAEKFANR